MSIADDSTRSYLGPGCVFEGEIRGSGSLECHGVIEGSIELDGDVVVGERGTAKARIAGRRVVVDGTLEGDAIGVERVEVGATGQVLGDIRAQSVSFAEGAVFEGNVEMRSAKREGEQS
jgi:cytoskeletal protein CcmA (bactofilin family)